MSIVSLPCFFQIAYLSAITKFSRKVTSRMKGLSVILSYCLRANLVHSFSPPVSELFDAAASGPGDPKSRDNEIMPQSNGVEDYLAESMLSSKGPPTSLDTQLPQSRSNFHPIHVRIDQPFMSNDQSNPLKPSDSKNLALDPGDLPSLPSIPFLGGSGEMDYGGPNPLQQLQQLWHNAVDEHKPPEPKCKERTIPWGGNNLLKMFAMCCGAVPKNTGPGSRDRLRVGWRRINCYLCKYLIESRFSNLFSSISSFFVTTLLLNGWDGVFITCRDTSRELST